MTKVDQFESAFRSAAKPVYEFQLPEIRKVLIATDFDSEAAMDTFVSQMSEFLFVISDAEWTQVGGKAFTTASELLELVDGGDFDLVCTYRNLHSRAWKWPHSLGTHLDVLTQAASCPVLVVTHPERNGAMPHAMKNTDVVMAITDHLTGDDRLVNYAVRFTLEEGALHLTHVEDAAAFDRYIDVISKIPAIDTDTAREAIRAQLSKEPEDYIDSCREILEEADAKIEIHGTVKMGQRLAEYKRLIEEHEVDLLVMNTKDEDHTAMHGMAYPLAVELRDIPLLML